MAVWLVRAVDEAPPAAVGSSRFVDVDTGEWWLPYVERLADLGITRGCAVEPARFCPADPVTRQQMASFLVRAFQLERETSNRFADVEADNSHLADINGLATGRDYRRLLHRNQPFIVPPWPPPARRWPPSWLGLWGSPLSRHRKKPPRKLKTPHSRAKTAISPR